MKVGLYARVSTDEQAREGYSIAAQSKKLKQYAELNDWNYELYVDEGYSAKDFKRPYVSKLLKDIKEGAISTVVIYKLDRLTRNVKNLYELMDLFDKNNCKLISLTESLDTSSASGRFFITMLGAMAQWERETIGERVFVGMKEAVKSKKIVGKAPYGYKKNENKFEINKNQANVVKFIFNSYKSGMGAEGIANALFKEKLVSSDESWDATKIFRIIKNKAYTGTYTVNFKDGENIEIPDTYPVIIPEDLFNQVNELREKKKLLHPRAKSSSRLFTGVLKCSCCGGKIMGDSAKNMRYACENAFSHNKCKSGTFAEVELEDKFVEYVTSYLNSLVEGENTIKNQPSNSKTKFLKELDKIKNIKSKNHIAFENDLISLEVYKARISELNQREQELVSILGKVTDIPKIFSLEGQDFGKLWKYLEREDKRNFILTHIQEINMLKEPRTKTLGKLKINNIDFI